MNNEDMKAFQRKIDEIVKDYLYSISSLKKHNYFKNADVVDNRKKYYQNTGFDILASGNENTYVVKEEMFLEGCTRVFLVNPIMKQLLDSHRIINDWQFGNTFANFNISNREYELGSFLEFIAVLDGKRIGIRYTKTSYSTQESFTMQRDSAYIFGRAKIPGFDVLSPVDMVYVLDWSGMTKDELAEIHPGIDGLKSNTKDISIKSFFKKYYSIDEYNVVISVMREAVKHAKDIIALRAVPQLLPDNMLHFKNTVLDDFTEERICLLQYEFKQNTYPIGLNTDDMDIIRSTFFSENLSDALIGKADFAKSFITSEYLFRTIKDGLSIDYTSVVVGYLKSVEQLLYLLYINAFEGKAGMIYWDRCNKTEKFDASNANQYRYDPYNLEKKWMQERYYHKKKTGNNSPEMGELTKFIRYYEQMWRVSEDGKEYIYKCLDDFRNSCRNSHFHKDNIDASEYDTVKRIRNNAHVCLYYLLGGFYYLNSSTDIKEQLGIIDYSFERVYQMICERRMRFFDARFQDGSEAIICYLNNDRDVEYSEAGELKNAQLAFLRTDLNEVNAFISIINTLLEDEDYVNEHKIYITHDNMPAEMKPIYPKKEKK